MTDEPPIVAPPLAPPAEIQTKERRYPCKGCGAALEYKPGSDKVACPYCNFVETIPRTDAEIDEFSFNDYLARPQKGLGAGGRDVRCGQCAAILHLDVTTKATRCAFCGTPIVDELGDAGAADVRPEAIAPFRIEARDAEERFRAWVKRLWFAPSLLKQEIKDSRVRGVYCPYWTYDAHTLSAYEGQRGDYYYVTQSYTATVNGRPVTKTRQVRHVRWSCVSGRYEKFFDDVVVPGGAVPPGLAYDVNNLKPYEPNYLSGFDAQRPTVAVEGGWRAAKETVNGYIYSGVCRRIGGDEQRGVHIKTAYRAITFKMVLLPVYISSYRYKDKIYQFLVDGQTGAVRGARPWSITKILGVLLLLGAVALAAAGAAALASR